MDIQQKCSPLFKTFPARPLLHRLRSRYFSLPTAERPRDPHQLMTAVEARLATPLTARQSRYVMTPSKRRVKRVLRLLAAQLFPRRGGHRRTGANPSNQGRHEQ
jgi:hypothetical protein